MVLGVFVSLMVPGLGLWGSLHQGKATTIVLVSVKLVIFCYPNSSLLVVGERATIHAKIRSVFVAVALSFLSLIYRTLIHRFFSPYLISIRC